VNRSITKLALAAAAALASAGVGASGAEAATRCTVANGLLEVHTTESGDYASFATANGTIGISGRSGTITCTGGTPTTRTVDTVLVVDDSDRPSTPAGYDGTTVVEINGPGPVGPGKTEELGEDEIGFLVDARNGTDYLTVGGQSQRRLVVGNDGLNWNNDSDADVLGMPFDDIRLLGSRSYGDLLSGQGGDGTGPALSTATGFQVLGYEGADQLKGSDIATGDGLEGGQGDDTVEGFARGDRMLGGEGGDELDGGTGDDRFEPAAGDDTVRGGAGTDTVDSASPPRP
jgi:hypothetical protein